MLHERRRPAETLDLGAALTHRAVVTLGAVIFPFAGRAPRQAAMPWPLLEESRFIQVCLRDTHVDEDLPRQTILLCVVG